MKKGTWVYEITLALQKLGMGNDKEIVDNIAKRGNIDPYKIANAEEVVRATIQAYCKDFKRYNSNNPSIFKQVSRGCYSLDEDYKKKDMLGILE